MILEDKMVKLSDTKIKKCQGEAYFRCFGNQQLASLLSRTQSLVIKNGNDLEDMILKRVNIIDNLDKYLETTNHQGISVVPKTSIKKSNIIKFDGVEPDFMVFVEKDNKKACHLIELKDGCEFDTKSSSAEKEHLYEFIRKNAQKMQYTFDGHICCFNKTSREEIVKGFKNKITKDDALTGREFCELLEIDYDDIVNTRKKDRESNLDYFLKVAIIDKELHLKLTSLLAR